MRTRDEQMKFLNGQQHIDFMEFLRNHYEGFDMEDCLEKFERWQEGLAQANHTSEVTHARP